MAATTDFVHDEAIVDAILLQLAAHLPSTWTSGQDPVWRLKRLEFGDLRDYRPTDEEPPHNLCPAVLVRMDRSEDHTPEAGGIGGKQAQGHPVRVVHLFACEQCRDAGTTATIISAARARAQRAKIINKALFADRDLGNPALTTDDTHARVLECRPVGIFYDIAEDQISPDLFALALDIHVFTRTL
jgi:hypothetical protein